jgi:hypothetical protein
MPLGKVLSVADYAGMHVPTEGDLGHIKDAVDQTLPSLGRRVPSIVNYDSFVADPTSWTSMRTS